MKDSKINDILEDMDVLLSGKAEPVEEPEDPKEYDPEKEEKDDVKAWGTGFDKEPKPEEKSEEKPETKTEPKSEVKSAPKPKATPEPLETKADHGSIIVERQYRIPTEAEPTKYETKTLRTPVMRFLTQPAKVTVKYGATLNIGNYESARVDVAVEMPCYSEDVDETYRLVSDYAGTLIESQVEDIRDSLKAESKSPAEDESPF